jgi:hypothetical protein
MSSSRSTRDRSINLVDDMGECTSENKKSAFEVGVASTVLSYDLGALLLLADLGLGVDARGGNEFLKCRGLVPSTGSICMDSNLEISSS